MSTALLITADEAKDWQREEIAALGTTAYCEGLIAQAQGELEQFLGYDPFIHLEERFCPVWHTGDTYVPYTTAKSVYPFVQVDASSYEPSSGYYTVSISTDGKQLEVLSTNPLPSTLDVYRGWRSSNHTLDGAGSTIDLNDVSGLSGLTALPPLVPDVIKAALCNMVLYFARYAVKFGLNSYSVDLGDQIKTVETVQDIAVLNGILQTCLKYKEVRT